ncbi:glycosyltransferase family 1 protein [Lophiostoma macrostomum CBS 122681]|uniref:UDP-N-acetylglucosamine transferase subunit ALG14 n=1 Tax=Lophiostoma macrostomum CBS 122681 TaxID=1314788 RepID=A0A6A6T0R6_9PLEO|nr:glycosyltransferase family 1 protein [Lophiostoma macrostomum CBS 122681]
MAPPPSALYTTTFFLAFLLTLFVAASLRLLAILPHGPFRPTPIRRRPIATRVLIVLGSGGHTHEMFYLLRDLDTRKYTHRTYVVSSGDAFSASRAVEFEGVLEARAREAEREKEERDLASTNPTIKTRRQRDNADDTITARPFCVGPDHYTITTLPRARAIHQSLLTTPFTCLLTLLSAFGPLLSSPSELSSPNHNQNPSTPAPSASPDPYDISTRTPPSLLLTNGPATSVILILASLILKFFDIRGCASQGLCKTIYVESFARVRKLSLSGRILVWCVDRFLVQWEELEGLGPGGRSEFWGVLV